MSVDNARLACVDCGAGFLRTAGRGAPRKRCQQCSPSQARPEAERLEERRREAVCQACSASFIATYGTQIYCGQKCRNRASNVEGQKRRRDSSTRPCRWCGTLFTPPYGSLLKQFCCRDCQAAASKKVRSGSTHRRRAAKFGCDYQVVDKRKVFERDGWKCYLCGCDTPKEMSGTTNDFAPELDHVVPLAGGGAHSYENTRCACRACNRSKGAKLLNTPRAQDA